MKPSRRYISFAAMLVAVAVMLLPPRIALPADSAAEYHLSEVVIEIADDAFIDWNPPDDPNYPLERDFITWIFGAGVREAGAATLSGEKPARLEIVVTRFVAAQNRAVFGVFRSVSGYN